MEKILDYKLVSLAITLGIAILGGGIAWGTSSKAIADNADGIKEVKKELSERIDRMDRRVDKRFDRMEKMLLKIYRKVR